MNNLLHSRRRAALLLAIVLPLLRLARASAQEENEAGYRRELYQEDKDRIRVDTDSFGFGVKLSDHVHLRGEVVLDAISGATPTGAPPQTKWPFPSYNDYYASALRQSTGIQFNQYLNENVIYADAGYITYAQLTNDATAFAHNTAPTIATNSANGSYNALINNPNYRNTKVPVVPMHDRRTAVSLQLPLSFGIHELTPSIAYSEENDYISWGGALNYSIALNNKNTTFSLGWAHNADRVLDDLRVWRDKTTDEGFLGVVQLLTPKSYVTLNCTFGAERGYLSDPYRGVMALLNFPQLDPADAGLLPEKRPGQRTKQIVYVSWNQFVTPLHGAAELSYRFYHDSYGIFSHTVQLNWHQKIGRQLVVSPMFRYSRQSAADFYSVMVSDFNHLPAAYSSDYRLSDLQTFAAGLNLSWRVHKYVSLDAGYLRYVMQGLDGVTSPSAYPSANVYTLGLRVWF